MTERSTDVVWWAGSVPGTGLSSLPSCAPSRCIVEVSPSLVTVHIYRNGRSWTGIADEAGLSSGDPSPAALTLGGGTRLARVRRAIEEVRASGWDVGRPERIRVGSGEEDVAALLFTDVVGAGLPNQRAGRKGLTLGRGGVPVVYAVVTLTPRNDAKAFLSCVTQRLTNERSLIDGTRREQKATRRETRALDRAAASVRQVPGHREDDQERNPIPIMRYAAAPSLCAVLNSYKDKFQNH